VGHPANAEPEPIDGARDAADGEAAA